MCNLVFQSIGMFFSFLSQKCSRLVTIASCLLMVTHELHPVKAVLFYPNKASSVLLEVLSVV